MTERSGLFGERWLHFNEPQKWLLLPSLAVLVLVGILLIFAQTSGLAFVIYTIF